jgi:hypothetical protein
MKMFSNDGFVRFSSRVCKFKQTKLANPSGKPYKTDHHSKTFLSILDWQKTFFPFRKETSVAKEVKFVVFKPAGWHCPQD